MQVAEKRRLPPSWSREVLGSRGPLSSIQSPQARIRARPGPMFSRVMPPRPVIVLVETEVLVHGGVGAEGVRADPKSAVLPEPLGGCGVEAGDVVVVVVVRPRDLLVAEVVEAGQPGVQHNV